MRRRRRRAKTYLRRFLSLFLMRTSVTKFECKAFLPFTTAEVEILTLIVPNDRSFDANVASNSGRSR